MSLTTCERGTASVEIVVMLPLFVVLLLGATHVHELGLARQQALSDARGCAFYYAVNGCTEEAAAHPICKGRSPRRGSPLTNDEAGQDTKSHHGVIETLGSWQIVDTLVTGLFGQGSSASSVRTVPGFMSRQERKVSGSFYVVCNTVSESWSDKAEDFMCGAAAKLSIKGALGHVGLCK